MMGSSPQRLWTSLPRGNSQRSNAGWRKRFASMNIENNWIFWFHKVILLYGTALYIIHSHGRRSSRISFLLYCTEGRTQNIHTHKHKHSGIDSVPFEQSLDGENVKWDELFIYKWNALNWDKWEKYNVLLSLHVICVGCVGVMGQCRRNR